LNNVYNDKSYLRVRNELKEQFAQLRNDIGDDGSHYPECEKVVQEFWDYSEADHQKAIEISHAFLIIRKAELAKARQKSGSKKKKYETFTR
jgi:N-acetylglucosamine-6-sulfatase